RGPGNTHKRIIGLRIHKHLRGRIHAGCRAATGKQAVNHASACTYGRTTSMARQLISSGSQFEHDIGYSRAVVDGEWIFVSGTTGFNYDTMTISDNLLEQTDQC